MALGLTLASAPVTYVTDILLIHSVNIKAHGGRCLVNMATSVLKELTVQGRTQIRKGALHHEVSAVLCQSAKGMAAYDDSCLSETLAV